MYDKNLGEALLQLDLSPSKSPSFQIERIIEVDRIRIKWLTRITVGLWSLAAAGAILIFIGGGLVFPLLAKTIESASNGDPGVATSADAPLRILAKFLAMDILISSASFVALVGAGLATVLLVFRMRRATLRQINANLLHISESLKQLAANSSPPKAPGL